MATLTNPLLLATFPLPPTKTAGSSKRKTSKGSKADSPATVHISPIASSSSHPHRNPEVVLSAPGGGGVWIYDLSTQQAITSYSIPPGTVLAGGPISWTIPRNVADRARETLSGESLRAEISKDKWSRRTVVPVEAGDGGGLAWVWDGDDVFEKREIKTASSVSNLQHIPNSNSVLAFGSASTSLAILTPSLKSLDVPFPAQASSSSSGTPELVSVHLISTPASKSSGIVPGTSTCILTYSSGTITTCTLSPTDASEEDWTIRGGQSLGILDGLLGADEVVAEAIIDTIGGAVHLTTSSGRIIPKVATYTLSNTSGVTFSRAPAASKPYTFHANSPSASTIPTTSVQSQPSSILLSSLPSTTDSPCTLILHHPLYPSVLATLALPRTLSRVASIQRFSESLVGVVGITKAHAEEKEGHDGKEKGVVLVVEVGVGGRFVGIAQLLGSGAVTKRWLSVEADKQLAEGASGTEENTSEEVDGFPEHEGSFLRGFETALKASKPKDVETLNRLWRAYESGVSAVRGTYRPDTTRQLASRLIKSIFAAMLGPVPSAISSSAGATTSTDTANPMQSLLAPATSTQPLKAAYPKEVVQALLEKGWLADGMWAEGGGVLAGLARIGDWETINLALSAFANVPSATLVYLLQLVLRASVPKEEDPDAMDTSANATPKTNIPSLQAFLHTYIRVPVSLPLHRVALFKGLREVGDVTRVLGGLEARLMGIEGLILDLEQVKSASGARKDVLSEEKLIVQHITLLLDAHLDPLLSYEPGQDLLLRLNDWVRPARQAQVELSLAKGVIEAFVRANKLDAKQSSKNGKQGKVATGQKDKAGGSLLGKREFDGLYSLEEVIL